MLFLLSALRFVLMKMADMPVKAALAFACPPDLTVRFSFNYSFFRGPPRASRNQTDP